jgi:virginiamycin B lyase
MSMTKTALPKIAAAIMVGWAAGAIAGFTPAFAQASLPEGNGKELVQSICQGCHDLSLIFSSGGFTRRDWEQVVVAMINMGAVIKPEEEKIIIDYLAASFPPGGTKQ